MQKRKKVQQAADFLHDEYQHAAETTVGLVLGTGLGGLAGALEESFSVPYERIPGFPHSTVESHKGALGHGTLKGVPVWTLQGRFHLYEGYNPGEVCMGVRTLAQLGVRTLIVTNAAGALNPQFDAGGLMLVTDHVNLTGFSPLTGENIDEWGPRFPDMCEVYSTRLREIALQAALDLGVRLERGVYVGVTGPNMETPAETRFYRAMGGDAIGMSTVLEAVAARHMGVEVLAVSCLTNKNLPDCMQPASLEDVIATAGEACGRLSRLVGEVVTRLGA